MILSSWPYFMILRFPNRSYFNWKFVKKNEMKNVSSKMKNEGERKKESKKKKINVKCQKKN